jgi:hypothetical protein
MRMCALLFNSVKLTQRCQRVKGPRLLTGCSTSSVLYAALLCCQLLFALRGGGGGHIHIHMQYSTCIPHMYQTP